MIATSGIEVIHHGGVEDTEENLQKGWRRSTRAVVTGFALEGNDAFAGDDGNHDESGHEVCPPPAEQGIQQ